MTIKPTLYTRDIGGNFHELPADGSNMLAGDTGAEVRASASTSQTTPPHFVIINFLLNAIVVLIALLVSP